MSASIKSFATMDKVKVINRRLAVGNVEIVKAQQEKRVPLVGLGYWGAVAAHKKMS